MSRNLLNAPLASSRTPVAPPWPGNPPTVLVVRPYPYAGDPLGEYDAVVITYTLPIWASLLAWPLLGERPSWRQFVALVLAIGGVALLVGAGTAASRWLRFSVPQPI